MRESRPEESIECQVLTDKYIFWKHPGFDQITQDVDFFIPGMEQMDTIRLRRSKKANKRYDAVFQDRIVSFGQRGGSTYIDHQDDVKKDNYLARHKVNENWRDPYSAGALSRYILWNKLTLEASLRDYGRRFGIKPIL